MPFAARKAFLFAGKQFLPGDPIPDFPDGFTNSESFIRSGFVVETKAPPKKAVKRKPVMEEVLPEEIKAV
jgi:hypothetical protein